MDLKTPFWFGTEYRVLSSVTVKREKEHVLQSRLNLKFIFVTDFGTSTCNVAVMYYGFPEKPIVPLAKELVKNLC